MKKNLLFLIAFLTGFTFLSAQTVVFSDNFESYENALSLASAGYILWEGGANVVDITVDPGTTASSGTKYAKCLPSAQNFYLRKEGLVLEVGAQYTFEVMTRSPSGSNHRAVARVGSRSVQGALINATEWTKTSIPFTVAEGETQAVFWVYSFPVSRVDVDDFIITKVTPTGLESVKHSFGFWPNPAKDHLFINNAEKVSSVSIISVTGQEIKHQPATGQSSLRLDISDLNPGFYFISIMDTDQKKYTERFIKE